MISVVIPMYNASATIERCLHSVLGQTYTDLEIIVVDDGSKDDSAKIVEGFTQLDGRIHYYYKENGGVSSARNFGLDRATGKYICFIDSDDAIEKGYIGSLYDKIVSADSDIAVCGYTEVKGETTIRYCLTNSEMDKLKGTIQTDFHVLRKFLGSPWMKLYKLKIIQDYSLHFREDMVTAEDQYFNYQYYQYCRSISFVNSPSYIYHSLESTLSQRRTQQCLENEIENIGFGIRFMQRFAIEEGEKIIAISICYAVRRYMFLTDAQNTYPDCQERMNRLNLQHRRVHLPRWQDNVIYQLMLHRQYYALYVYWRFRLLLLR